MRMFLSAPYRQQLTRKFASFPTLSLVVMPTLKDPSLVFYVPRQCLSNLNVCIYESSRLLIEMKTLVQ